MSVERVCLWRKFVFYVVSYIARKLGQAWRPITPVKQVSSHHRRRVNVV